MTLATYELGLRLGTFVSVFALMAAWELASPARAPRLGRLRRWRTNLGLAALNVLVLRLALPGTTLIAASVAQAHGWGLVNGMRLSGLPGVLVAIVLLDLALFLQHVLFHNVPALARVHAVHHADLDFDVTTGLRFHPVEIMISALIRFAAVVVLGAPVAAVLVFEVLLNATSMFNHSNVSLPGWLEHRIRWILVTPDMHRIHHSVAKSERNSNFGFCLPIWDRLLGTYTATAAGVLDIGLSAWRDPATVASLGGVLRMPFAQESYSRKEQ